MVFNKVNVKCASCGKDTVEIKGYYTKVLGDKETRYNHYWCSSCHHSWEEERTDKNLHKEYFPDKKK